MNPKEQLEKKMIQIPDDVRSDPHSAYAAVRLAQMRRERPDPIHQVLAALSSPRPPAAPPTPE
jgi:hypothetical protein